MKKIKFAVLALAGLLVLGCQKDEPIPVENEVSQFFNRNSPEPETFTITASVGGTYTGSQGTKITIPADAFTDLNGNPVTGEVDFEFLEIFAKSDIILANKPTITTSGSILESAGEFYFNATQDGNQLMLAKPVQVQAPAPNQIPDMFLFIASTDAAGNFAWAPRDSAGFYWSQASYFFDTDSLTWINIDKYIPGTNTTEVRVVLPAGFDYDKARAFMAFDNLNSVLGLYSSSQQYFAQDGISVGEEITVLILAERNGKLYAGKQSLSVEANQVISIQLDELSDAEIKVLIESVD